MLPLLISFLPGIFIIKTFSGLSAGRGARASAARQLLWPEGSRLCFCKSLQRYCRSVLLQRCLQCSGCPRFVPLSPPGCPPEADVLLGADTQAVPGQHWPGSSPVPSHLHQFAYQQCGGNNMCFPAFVDVKRLLMGTHSPQTVTDTVASSPTDTDKNAQPCLSPRRSKRCCKGFSEGSQ